MSIFIRLVLTRSGLAALLDSGVFIKKLRVIAHAQLFEAVVGSDGMALVQELQKIPNALAELPEEKTS